MNLIGEQFVPNQTDNSKKLRKIILIAIIALIIAIVIIILIMAFVKEEKWVIKLNGKETSDLKNIIQFEEDGSLNIPIRDMANYLGYESYNGNYLNKSEDSNECYVEIDEEAAVFSINTDKIEKINKDTQETTYFNIDKPIKMIDGKLYTTQEGIERAFNSKINYNQQKKQINIYTMQYLNDKYKDSILEFGFNDISSEFNDQKAILNNLVIVKDAKGKYGVFNLENDEKILETKYDEIKYLEVSNEFYIKSNNKVGIKTSEGKDKIKMQYDNIELISQESKLYVVKQENKYGVINQNENVVIPVYCEKIGIDLSNFSKNNIKNKYIIIDKIIPVMRNNLWGLYDIEGKKLADFQYNSLGCTSSSTRNTENLLVIPDFNVIIGAKNKKYVLINQYGEELLNGATFDEAYMTIDYDEVKYYLIRNEKQYDALELLQRLKERNSLGTNNKQTENEQEEENQQEYDQEQDDQNEENEE